MVMKSRVSVLFLCVIIVCLCGFSEQNTSADPEPFRMRKVNLVWEKAKRSSLTKDKLNELFVELQLQDKDERKLKKQKAEGLDKDGEKEAIVQHNMARILSKYDLDGQKKQTKQDRKENLFDLESNTVKLGPQARDERLDKLWLAALEEEHFTRAELEQLQKELNHHHEKWREYNSLADMVTEHEGRTANHLGKRTKEDDVTLDELRKEMNMKEKDVHDNYRRLKTKVLVSKPAEAEFEDQRVRDLWNKARELIKSEDQLSIMKEQLKHFDHKIAKHDNFREQLDVAEDLLSQGHDHIKQKHDKLSSKVNEHRKYIKKMHVTLKDKIMSHNEL